MEYPFPTWEELTVVEQLQCSYSDYHKDVYGFRPRSMTTEQWNSESWLRNQIAELERVAPAIFAAAKEDELAAIADFEKAVDKYIADGARDRDTALRWMMQASDCDGDWDYFCFKYGIPYGYVWEK